MPDAEALQAEADRLHDQLIALSQSFRQTFDGIHGQRVLTRLAEFCHARKTTHVKGERPLASAQLEGRRQVWLLIEEMSELTKEEAAAKVVEMMKQRGDE